MSDLSRFLTAQSDTYDQALAELRAGAKRSHWMWFVFPQVAGLGVSSMAQRYALSGLDEAREYAEHPVLGARLRECCRVLLDLPEDASAEQVLGWVDAMKLRSSMTIFELAVPGEAMFGEILDRFYGGSSDDRTVQLLGMTDAPPPGQASS